MNEGDVIKVEDLYVEYKTEDGYAKAVNGIGFTLRKGETLGIVGETGAGKTTLALSVMRLLPQNIGVIKSGQIIFEGKDLLRMPEREMRSIRGNKIAMVFQDPMTSLNPVMTVGKQIEEIIRLHTELEGTAVSDRVDELLQMVNIDARRKNDYPHQFSGGMKQRIVIAIALACDPELLIADEPTTALDVTIQAQVLAMIDEIQKKTGTSLILITHDFGIVSQLCDKVAVMYAGKIVEMGTLEQIFDEKRCHHPYTKGLFDSIPDMNRKQRRLKGIPGLMPGPLELPIGCKFADRCPLCVEECKKAEPGVYAANGHEIMCCRTGKAGDTDE